MVTTAFSDALSGMAFHDGQRAGSEVCLAVAILAYRRRVAAGGNLRKLRPGRRFGRIHRRAVRAFTNGDDDGIVLVLMAAHVGFGLRIAERDRLPLPVDHVDVVALRHAVVATHDRHDNERSFHVRPFGNRCSA